MYVHSSFLHNRPRLEITRWTMNRATVAPHHGPHSAVKGILATTGRSVHQFPRTAVTNYHEFSGFKKRNFILGALEARNATQGVRTQGWFLPKALSENLSRACVPASGGCQRLFLSFALWLHHAILCLCLPVAFPSVCLCVSHLPPFTLIRTPVLGLRAQHIDSIISSQDPLNECHLPSPHFHISHIYRFQGLELRPVFYRKTVQPTSDLREVLTWLHRYLCKMETGGGYVDPCTFSTMAYASMIPPK